MKLTSLLLMVIMFSLATILACKKPVPKDTTSKAYTSAYVCPMHCEGSGSDTSGTCPVCGMDYIIREKHTNDGHKHE